MEIKGSITATKVNATLSNKTPDWQSGVSYVTGDLIIYSGILYRCNASHSSSGFGFPTDVAKWSDISLIKTLQIEAFVRGSSVLVGYTDPDVVVPASMNGYELINVVASVQNKGVTGSTDIQIEKFRNATLAMMLSTKVTIGDQWFAQDGVVELGLERVVQTGDKLRVQVTGIHSGTAPVGLVVVMEFQKK